MAETKTADGKKKSEGRKTTASLREALNKLNSVQLKNFYAGLKNLKSHKTAIDAALKAHDGKAAAKIQKQIAKLQKQLDAAKAK
jgi:hypothetical protein